MKSTRLSLKQILAFGPIIGAEGEGESGASGAGEGTQGGEGGTQGGAEGAPPGPPAGSEGGDPQKKIAAQQEEIQRHFSARQKAEGERDELQKWKDEQERKTKSDVENLQTDLKTAKDTIAQLTTTNQSLMIENAFLQANTHEWHNPKRALASADLSAVTIKDGVVDEKALKDALDKLAKDEPYLVKPKEGDGKPPAGGPTGTPPSGQGSKQTDQETLRRKYPALRLH
jgi:hypothetical protein